MDPCTARSNARPRLGLRMSSFVVFATAASGSWMSTLIVDSATWLFRYRIWPGDLVDLQLHLVELVLDREALADRGGLRHQPVQHASARRVDLHVRLRVDVLGGDVLPVDLRGIDRAERARAAPSPCRSWRPGSAGCTCRCRRPRWWTTTPTRRSSRRSRTRVAATLVKPPSEIVTAIGTVPDDLRKIRGFGRRAVAVARP